MKRGWLIAVVAAAGLYGQGVDGSGFFMPPGFAFQGRNAQMETAEREYQRGTQALDEKKWSDAVQAFTQASLQGGAKADAALYWKAYALSKLGRNGEALGLLDSLSRSHPSSKWLDDARALRVEVSRAAGKPVSPEEAADEEIKLMAINSLIRAEPDRAITLLEGILKNNSGSPRLRERALFVLGQSKSPQAGALVERIARGEMGPDLQGHAVRALGMSGGAAGRKVLGEVLFTTKDIKIKKDIMRAFMLSGDRERVLAAAKSDPTPEVRSEAIRMLGMMGGTSELVQMYTGESSVAMRREILQAIARHGGGPKLAELLKDERDPALKAKGVQMLGMSSKEQTGPMLASTYASSPEPEVKKAALEGMMMQNNAAALVEIARKETNPELKKTAVRYLSHMGNSKEATDYMMELLK